jgi:hypothetical protein
MKTETCIAYFLRQSDLYRIDVTSRRDGRIIFWNTWLFDDEDEARHFFNTIITRSS